MSEKNADIALNTMFSFNGFGCKCVKDIQNETPDKPPKILLKWYADTDKPLKFAYASKSGLNLTGNAGGVVKGNILGQLLGIPQGDLDKHIEFFKMYGFLFPISSEEYTVIDAVALMEIVNRIKSTVRLMNAINSRKFKGALVHIAYLLYSAPVRVKLLNNVFATFRHRFSELLESYDIFPDLNADQEVFSKGTYSVPDSMIGASNPIPIEFYNAVRSGTESNVKGSRDPRFKRLMAMYTGCRDESYETRLLIDFFYHFQTEVSVIKDVQFGKIIPYSKIDENALGAEIRDSLLRVSKVVLAREINYNISGIHPFYDGEKLVASWELDSLIQALYFSIFYMKRGEIYKECENPNCKREKYFLVPTTRSSKKYCCIQCSRAAASQRHRDRQQT